MDKETVLIRNSGQLHEESTVRAVIYTINPGEWIGLAIPNQVEAMFCKVKQVIIVSDDSYPINNMYPDFVITTHKTLP